MDHQNRPRFSKFGCLVLFVFLIVIPSSIEAQSSKLEGMWSDTPSTALGLFCFGYCTDVGIDRLNKLLDDPANDARPYEELSAEATTYQRENYIKPKLIGEAKSSYPLDPLKDPSYVRCIPWGVGRQIFAPHQLEIRQRDKSRIEMRYGEWDGCTWMLLMPPVKSRSGASSSIADSTYPKVDGQRIPSSQSSE